MDVLHFPSQVAADRYALEQRIAALQSHPSPPISQSTDARHTLKLQLDALNAPIYKLSDELLADIFLVGLDQYLEEDRFDLVRLWQYRATLCSTVSRFRRVAMSVARMWAIVKVETFTSPSDPTSRWAYAAGEGPDICRKDTLLDLFVELTVNMPDPPAVDPRVRITTLPNQVRVTTEESPGHFHSIGVYLDAGARYETPRLSGVSHMLDRMAFKSTSTHSAEETAAILDATGMQIQCTSTRESMMYQSTHFPSDLPLALSLIASTLQQPLLLPEELEESKAAAAYELREIISKPELILPEVVHQAAFGGETLGRPLLCPEDRFELITPDIIREYLSTYVRPERIVVAGAGMPHEQLVELTEQYFGQMPYHETTASPTQRFAPPSATQPLTPPPSPPSGNVPSLTARLSTMSSSLFHPHPSTGPLVPPPREPAVHRPSTFLEPDSSLPFTHLHLAFPSLPISHPSLYALAVLQVLLGGGSSFSAGGPGKGMYSRCYTHILNRHHNIDSCQAFHHIYTDAGLFGISASCTHNTVGSLPAVLGGFMAQLMQPKNIQSSELSRAKNQLKSSIAMSLESRAVEVEDLGRQVQVHGRRIGIREMDERIDEVEKEDVEQIARDVLSGGVTVVARGEVDALGDVRATLGKYGIGLGKDANGYALGRGGWFR
ncbi:LuxS/MPP-like metallohydrolase [Calocera cornea HHB12733]|uniref:Alpha-MPP n=1 Tax=Calocera cornea HHB12733 TaxID=1353952 RepID=A0A165F2T1_9BASI|nr:LuxS/MPP-like metallohydrolase [Calocera cornea HHB12733]